MTEEEKKESPPEETKNSQIPQIPLQISSIHQIHPPSYIDKSSQIPYIQMVIGEISKAKATEVLKYLNLYFNLERVPNGHLTTGMEEKQSLEIITGEYKKPWIPGLQEAKIDLSHLKRVKPGGDLLKVIITSKLGFDGLLSDGTSMHIEFINENIMNIQENIQLPATAIHCKTLNDEISKTIWPLHYRKTAYECIHHTDYEIQKINDNILNELISQAEEAKSEGNIRNACCLYNPNTGTKYQYFRDASTLNPISHPPFLSIQNFSEGLRNLDNNKLVRDYDKIDELELLLPPSKRICKEASISEELGFQYYCKDLYMFCYREPCYMCAMALVHSRISRLYYVEDNIYDGGILSNGAYINYIPNINHHYYVFKICINNSI